MENATEALVIAGSIFLLMLALAVGVSSFTNVKGQVDDVLEYRQEVRMATDQEGNYINYIKKSNDIRTVSFAEIITAFRRMRQESYDIYIYLKNGVVPNSNEFKEKLGESIVECKSCMYKGQEIIPSSGQMIKLTISNVEKNSRLDEIINILYNSGMDDYTYDEYIGTYKEKAEEGVLEKENLQYKILTYIQK